MQKIDNNKNISVLISHDEHEFTKQDLLAGGITEEEADKIIKSKAIELIHDLDKETSDSILAFYEIKSHLEDNGNPILSESYRHILKGIEALAAKEPNKMHRDLVGYALINGEGDRQLKKFASDDKAIQDQLCRSFLKNIKTLLLNLRQAYPSDCSDERNFEKNDMFLADTVLLETISKSGKVDKEVLLEDEDQFKERFAVYKAGKKTITSLWFNTKNESQTTPFHLSAALKILSDYTWREESNCIRLKEKYVPAVKNKESSSILAITSPHALVKEDKSNIAVYSGEELLVNIHIAALQQNIVAKVVKGICALKSANAFRLIRHFSRRPFERFVSKDPDFRVLHYPGGAAELAKECGIASGRSEEEVNNILLAMAHGNFCCGSSSGNLIQLTRKNLSRMNQNFGLEITIGTLLFPYGSNQIEGLLVPLFPDPILVGSSNTYASQYHFHLQLSQEFSNKSNYYAQEGYIEIPSQTLQSMALNAKMTPNTLQKVMDRWTCDGDDAPRLLNKIEKDYYALGSSLEKESRFLKKQGLLRVERSRIGCAAAKKHKRQKFIK
jgi:hypothetical protein